MYVFCNILYIRESLQLFLPTWFFSDSCSIVVYLCCFHGAQYCVHTLGGIEYNVNYSFGWCGICSKYHQLYSYLVAYHQWMRNVLCQSYWVIDVLEQNFVVKGNISYFWRWNQVYWWTRTLFGQNIALLWLLFCLQEKRSHNDQEELNNIMQLPMYTMLVILIHISKISKLIPVVLYIVSSVQIYYLGFRGFCFMTQSHLLKMQLALYF